jgi:hypothetical protein
VPPFDDTHRTVIGYHGTTLSAALRVVNRLAPFRASDRDYDWLGRGIYFWEYAPRQALKWARVRQRQLAKKKNKTPEEAMRATEPLAVIASMIRLGNCFDLLDPGNVEELRDAFRDYHEAKQLAGETVPSNARQYRKLDCDVFEYTYNVIANSEGGLPVDTSRSVYVPTGGKKRLWQGSWISSDVHIQLCVRNPRNVLGSWLHTPESLEARQIYESLENSGIDITHDDSQGLRPLPED